MDVRSKTPDWSLIQAFLAVADSGSLSGAARELGRSQPTLGRQIQLLEEDLGTRLCDRHSRGLRLSDAGAELMPMARQMRDAMNALTLNAAGHAARLEGTVRITASVYASHFVLPTIIADLRRREPSIDIVLIPSDRAENLLFREADIAVRMYRPTQLDIITRHVADLELGAFAAKDYIARQGRPERAAELFDFDVIGYESTDLILRTMRDMGYPVTRESFAIRCDDQAACWQLLRGGCGIGFGQAETGRADPLLEELHLGIDIPPLEVWLAAHEAMRQTPRIRRVWDILAQGLQSLSS